jgi:hypothetical protein
MRNFCYKSNWMAPVPGKKWLSLINYLAVLQGQMKSKFVGNNGRRPHHLIAQRSRSLLIILISTIV